MAKHTGQKLKLLYVLDILRKYSDDEHPINATEIVEYLGNVGISAERKSVYDDIVMLEFYGYDIIKTDSPKVGWFIGEREFEVPEIFLLSDAVRSAKFISVKKSRELLAKLNGMLSMHQAKKHKNNIYFSATEKGGNEEIYYNIDKINSAIEKAKQIEVKYYKRDFGENRTVNQTIKEMVLNPYALCWQDDHYYMIGNHPKYVNLMQLRLDRIRDVKILEKPARHFSEVSDYKDYFDTSDYISKLFGMYSGEIMKIDLWCSKKITEQVIDRFGEEIFISHVSDDGFCISINAALSDALVTWIMNYGKNLKVTNPPELIEMIKNRAENVLENYKNENEKEKIS